MSQAVVRSRPMRRFERMRYRLNRWLARYRTNAAVVLAFAIASVAALVAASLLL
jgi:hypothetical protein